MRLRNEVEVLHDPEVDRMAVVRRIAEEQEFIAFAEGLTPQQWQAPTLCPGLLTRDIVEHVAWHFKIDDGAALAAIAVRTSFSKAGENTLRRLHEAAIRIAVDRGGYRLVVLTIAVGNRFTRLFRRIVLAARHRHRRLEPPQRDGHPSTRYSP
jgi:hypothetical protein